MGHARCQYILSIVSNGNATKCIISKQSSVASRPLKYAPSLVSRVCHPSGCSNLACPLTLPMRLAHGLPNIRLSPVVIRPAVSWCTRTFPRRGVRHGHRTTPRVLVTGVQRVPCEVHVRTIQGDGIIAPPLMATSNRAWPSGTAPPADQRRPIIVIHPVRQQRWLSRPRPHQRSDQPASSAPPHSSRATCSS